MDDTGATASEIEINTDRHLAYLLLRLAMGTAMLMHGLVRVFVIGAGTFAGGMVHKMAQTPLAPAMVRLFGAALPFGELALGVVLVLGLWTRWSLAAGAALMLVLIFGSAFAGDWPGISTQLSYAALFCALLGLRRYNALSADNWLRCRSARASLAKNNVLK